MSFESFRQFATHGIKFRLFLLYKLPSAFFSGVRLRSLTPERAEVSVPYKWFSQNPFKSTYFACQAMAAEMSTGILGLGHIHKKQPAVSMLVTGMQSHFYKKAVADTFFTCSQGLVIKEAIDKAIALGEPQTATVESIGKNAQGQEISRFTIEWSFKARQ